jgi:hypothetical protein
MVSAKLSLPNAFQVKPPTLQGLRRIYREILQSDDTPIFAIEAVGESFPSEGEMQQWLRSTAKMILGDSGPPPKAKYMAVEKNYALEGETVTIQVCFEHNAINAWIDGEDGSPCSEWLPPPNSLH